MIEQAITIEQLPLRYYRPDSAEIHPITVSPRENIADQLILVDLEKKAPYDPPVRRRLHSESRYRDTQYTWDILMHLAGQHPQAIRDLHLMADYLNFKPKYTYKDVHAVLSSEIMQKKGTLWKRLERRQVLGRMAELKRNEYIGNYQQHLGLHPAEFFGYASLEQILGFEGQTFGIRDIRGEMYEGVQSLDNSYIVMRKSTWDEMEKAAYSDVPGYSFPLPNFLRQCSTPLPTDSSAPEEYVF